MSAEPITGAPARASATGSPATRKPSGAAAAILISAGIGCAVLGLATALAQASATVQGWLNWWAPAGPLSGKSGVAVLAWLIAWAVLHGAWRAREVRLDRALVWSLAGFAIGFLLTFPPVFALGGH